MDVFPFLNFQEDAQAGEGDGIQVEEVEVERTGLPQGSADQERSANLVAFHRRRQGWTPSQLVRWVESPVVRWQDRVYLLQSQEEEGQFLYDLESQVTCYLPLEEGIAVRSGLPTMVPASGQDLDPQISQAFVASVNMRGQLKASTGDFLKKLSLIHI